MYVLVWNNTLYLLWIHIFTNSLIFLCKAWLIYIVHVNLKNLFIICKIYHGICNIVFNLLNFLFKISPVFVKLTMHFSKKKHFWVDHHENECFFKLSSFPCPCVYYIFVFILSFIHSIYSIVFCFKYINALSINI